MTRLAMMAAVLPLICLSLGAAKLVADEPPPSESKPAQTKPEAKEAKPPETKPEPPPQAAKPPEPKPAKPPDTKPEPPPQAAKPPEPKPAEPAKGAASPILNVKLAFMNDPRLFPYDINVEMKGDTAELHGKVTSESDRDAATEVAQNVDGIKSVVNKLEVSKDLAKSLTRKRDELITQYVRDRFGKSKTLDSARFDIKTEDGIVSLAGKTRFQVIALEAAETARQVPGVKAVRTDRIQVEGSD